VKQQFGAFMDGGAPALDHLQGVSLNGLFRVDRFLVQPFP
jgi:hypothetical protein